VSDGICTGSGMCTEYTCEVPEIDRKNYNRYMKGMIEKVTL
jgi:hypothetical protein